MHHSLFQIKSEIDNKIYNVFKLIKNQYIVMEVSLLSINNIKMTHFKKFYEVIEYIGKNNISKLDNTGGLTLIQELINNNYFTYEKRKENSYISLPFINDLEIVMTKLLSSNKNIKDPSSYIIDCIHISKTPSQTSIHGNLSCELFSLTEKVSEIVVHIEMRDLEENMDLFNNIKRLILFSERKLGYRITKMNFNVMLGSFLTALSDDKLNFEDIIDTIFIELEGATSTQFNYLFPISK
ncbi:hypothetical protein DA469_22060 [Bacillus subtilis]|nr:hypothetical protein DA469_22060 [Bacillus subtilis]